MSKGYNKMVVQAGKSSFIPEVVNNTQFHIEVYQYKDTLKQDMQEASLIISHGGKARSEDLWHHKWCGSSQFAAACVWSVSSLT